MLPRYKAYICIYHDTYSNADRNLGKINTHESIENDLLLKI